ncbi:hypothetical protein KEM54_006913 [Ascosphaera aggregata]|nr:hypothetical protein KEM54_006913 [Ascosphaera aggregata]
MEEDAIFDASLDDFAVSSSASPEIDHEYKNQSKQSQQNIELRRSSRLRSRFGLAESAETIDPVFGSRSEKSKHIKKVKDEHMNDSPSAHFTVNQGSPQHNESKTFVARSPMSRPPSTDSDKAALEASAQLRRSLDPNSPYINDNDGNDDNDDDDDDDDDGLDEVLFESTLRDPDADEVLDDYLERSLPVSLPTKMRLGLATGIGETDIASTELSFVSELADYDKQQESDDEDEVSMNGDNYDYDYDQENDVGDEGDVVNAPWESDAKLEMDVRDAMNGKLGASGSSGAPSRSESGTEDEMGNHGDVSTFTPEHSSREGSPDSWSPPGVSSWKSRCPTSKFSF